MVKTETEALPPDWPEGAFVKEEETPPAWPEGAIVKEEIKEEPPMWPEGAVVKQEQQELARAGPQDGATPMQQCGGHGCELARFHEGLCTSHSLAKATQQKRAAPPSEDSDGVEIESEKDEEAGVAEEGQNGATPTGQRGGNGGKHQNMQAWSPEEDTVILDMHIELGPSWSKIVQWLPGRNVSSVRNRWQRIEKGRKQREAGVPSKNRCHACGLPKRGHVCQAKLGGRPNVMKGPPTVTITDHLAANMPVRSTPLIPLAHPAHPTHHQTPPTSPAPPLPLRSDRRTPPNRALTALSLTPLPHSLRRRW